MSTFEEITTRYDGIIKSKWRLMCEVDCLPDICTAADGFVKLCSMTLKRACEGLGSKRDNLFLFWKRVAGSKTPMLSVIQLCFPTPDGSIHLLAQWELELSALEETKGAVKGLTLIIPKDGSQPIDELLKSTLPLVDTDVTGRTKMWRALPEKDQRKEESIVCPRCGTRGSIYIGEYTQNGRVTHAATCSCCDFIGPHRISDYDALESFLSRINAISRHEEKTKAFHAIAESELAEIEMHVKKIAALAANRNVSYTDLDVDNIMKKYNAAGEKLLRMKRSNTKK